MILSRAHLCRLLPELGQSEPTPMDAKTLYSLATLLLLVQLPHLLHLPIWVSATGASLILFRLALRQQPRRRFLRLISSPVSITVLAAVSAVLIRMDFGYFIGRDPAVAFLFVLVAAKFAEIRKPSDATLLLCLAAFLLLTQYFYSQTILAAALTLPAVIALAHCLAILRDPGNPSTTPQQLKLVVTLLLQGIPLAALLFLVFPRLPGPLWSLPEDSMASTGLSDSMSPGDIGQLSQSDAVAFRVDFDSTIPPPQQRYWRGPVLSEFDGRQWTVNPSRLKAQARDNRLSENTVGYTVTLQPHRQQWLFALETAVTLPRGIGESVNAGHAPPPLGYLMSDGQMIATSHVNQVLRYRQHSVLLDATVPNDYPPDSTLFLPGLNTRSNDFARKLRQSVQSNRDYANAVLKHFNQQDYYYTLQPQLLGNKPIDEFLFDSRRGFCEHYASAFVVLMRGAGIPARVVTGYLGGEMNENYMIVRQSDAHAWAEAYIEGAWRRYDPTGAVAPSRVEQGLAAALPNEASVPHLARFDASWLRSAQLRWDALNHHWQRWVVDFDNSSQDSLWRKLGLPKPALWQLTLVILLMTGLWSLLILNSPRSGHSTLAPSERLWRRLCWVLNAHKFIREPEETPSEFLARASQHWPDQAERLAYLQQEFDRLRFQSLADEEQDIRQNTIKRELSLLQWSLFKHRLPIISNTPKP